MAFSDRIEKTIDRWVDQWKNLVGGWLARWIAGSFDSFLEGIEPGTVDQLRATLTTLRDSPGTPQYMKDMIDTQLSGTAQWQSFVNLFLIPISMIGALLGMGAPVSNVVNYIVERDVKSFRLDPNTLTMLLRRDRPQWEKFLDDLKDQGWGEERLEAFKALLKVIPPLSDMVRFADFSAFDPEVIAKYRQFYTVPDWLTEAFRKVGIDNETVEQWANKYWFSHWRQPGRFELAEMYRRGELGTPRIGNYEIGLGYTEGEAEELVKLAYRTQGYSEFWQDRLLDLVREVPTRVDVRRWWDMRTISEAELKSIYQRQGYFGKDLENYVTWTKVYTDFPVLMARWKNGWIDIEDVRKRLIKLGMPEERVQEIIEEKVKAEEPARIEEGRALTKSEIYKGVKQGFITRDEGVELVMDLGYNRAEAEYLLDINVAVLEGSPETYAEFKDLTAKYRLAAGKEAKPMTEAIKQAADKLLQLQGDVVLLEQAVKEEQAKLFEGEPLPESATERLTELQVKHNRAITELENADIEYKRLVAEWRQS